MRSATGNLEPHWARWSSTFIGSSGADVIAPTVSGVTASNANGTYGATSVIGVQVNFSEPVIVSGTPQITLDSGVTVNYTSGSGTSTLLFNYTIAWPEESSDLDYTATNALSLNGGTIQDAAANNADLTLASPGAAGSLAANKEINISTKSYVDVTSTAAQSISSGYNTLIFGTVVQDLLSDYNSSTGLFTARHTGPHLFMCSALTTSTSFTAGNYINLDLKLNGANEARVFAHWTAEANITDYKGPLGQGGIVYLTAGDLCYLELKTGNSFNLHNGAPYVWMTIKEL